MTERVESRTTAPEKPPALYRKPEPVKNACLRCRFCRHVYGMRYSCQNGEVVGWFSSDFTGKVTVREKDTDFARILCKGDLFEPNWKVRILDYLKNLLLAKEPS